jgi:hypothetical protein
LTTRPGWAAVYRVRQIEFRLVMLRFSLPKACDGAAPLGLQRLDLPLRQFEGRLRARKGSLLLVKLRGILLGVLNAAIAGLPKVLVSRRLLLCEHQRRPCQIYLRLVGSDLGLLHVELRIDVLDTGLRRRDLSLCVLECRPIITIVDTGDHVAGFDMLVVRDGDRGNVAPTLLAQPWIAVPRRRHRRLIESGSHRRGKDSRQLAQMREAAHRPRKQRDDAAAARFAGACRSTVLSIHPVALTGHGFPFGGES